LRKKLGGRERVVFFDSCEEVKVVNKLAVSVINVELRAGKAVNSLNIF
jgi:hypothetical protein